MEPYTNLRPVTEKPPAANVTEERLRLQIGGGQARPPRDYDIRDWTATIGSLTFGICE